MKYKHLYTILILLIYSTIFSQEKVFEVIEHVPVYKGCDKNLPNSKLKNCMSEKISEHISKNFNISIANNIGLPDGLVRINAIFKIDAKGKITNIEAKGPHPELEKEAKRVIALIPDMERPGIQRGKAVIVPYTLPIVFVVDNSSKKLTKKEKRKLRKKNKS